MLNPFNWPFRAQYLAGAVVCIALLAYAIYVQTVLHIEPCPLCILQRVAFMAMGLFFFVGGVHGPGATGRRVYALLVLLSACAGASVSGYHLWVQHLPPDPLAGCTPGWNYMIENFPLSKTIKMIFTGHADCAEINWTFLGLAMPFWTLVCFVLIGSGALWAGFRRRIR